MLKFHNLPSNAIVNCFCCSLIGHSDRQLITIIIGVCMDCTLKIVHIATNTKIRHCKDIENISASKAFVLCSNNLTE